MTILHLPESFLPEHVGGKEVYTLRLAQELSAMGLKNVVAIHGQDAQSSHYEYEGIKVWVLPKLKHKTPYSDRYSREVAEISGFEKLLNELKPDLVHFHDQNGGASLSHLRMVKQKGIKAVVTFHTPGQVCPQRALLHAGKVICNGWLDVQRCTACQLRSLFNVPSGIADSIAAIARLKIKEPKNKLLKLLSHRHMTSMFINSYNEFVRLADNIIVYTPWSKQLYSINKIEMDKIKAVDTGGNSSIHWDKDRQYKKGDIFEICFIGRCEWIKGIHLLIEAVKQLDKRLPVKVYFYSGNWEKHNYGKSMLESIAHDERFEKPKLVKNTDLAEMIARHHACVIPSVWPETGPITVYDAFGSGLIVVGANSAGIAARVRHEVDGLLFENSSVEDLKKKLELLINNPDMYNLFRTNIIPNRTMKEVAFDMCGVYKRL